MAVQVVKEKFPEYNRLATHPLQSWEWGEFRKSLGQKVARLVKEEKRKPMAVFQVSFHKIPFLGATVGYLPKSNIPDDEILEALKQVGKENRAIFIKLEPNEEKTKQSLEKLKKLGLKEGKPLFTKFTSIINLEREEEEIFKSFKPKTRYNIRLAQRHGVVVKEDNSEESFEKYLKLLFETTKRQGFFAHSEEFHRKQWKILNPAGISHLLTASWKGKTLAAFLLFVFNETLYYPYGASTREHKELMAPSLLMWEAILFGKRMGCKSFDLWGDTEPNPPPDHPYFGFHRFKEGFSPLVKEFVGSWDLVLNPLGYQVYKTVDKVRWKILRKLRKRE